MKEDRNISLYWIRDVSHTDIENEGYIGVSYDPNKRYKEHLSTYTNYHEDFKDCINSGNTVMEIISTGDRFDMLEKEKQLRPSGGIGWNLKAGGGGTCTNPEKITYKGVTKTIKEWCEYRNISLNKFYHRRSLGWSVKDSLEYGDRHGKVGAKTTKHLYWEDILKLREQGYFYREIAEILGVDRKTIYQWRKQEGLV